MSFNWHRFDGLAITVHSALCSRSREIQDIIATASWMDVLQQMCAGLKHLTACLTYPILLVWLSILHIMPSFVKNADLHGSMVRAILYS